MRLIPIPVLFAVALFTVPALAAEAQITLSGTGNASLTPDLAVISTGVTTDGATARAALDANSTAMSAVLAALRSSGIDPKDLQTSGFSVNPTYVYTDGRDASGNPLPPTISGYQVTNAVTATLRDLDRLGIVLDETVTSGANTVNGISFSASNTTEALDSARTAAFADAKRKAEQYARLAGRTLGPVEAIAEGSAPPVYNQPMLRVAADAATAVPVAAGALTYEVTVTVTWSLLP